MSLYSIFIPIIAALIAPEGSFLPINNQWKAVNTQQEFFLNNCFDRSALAAFSHEELKFLSSKNHEELNKFALDNKINIFFAPFKPNEFGSLGIFTLKEQWVHIGRESSLVFNNTPVESVIFDKGFQVIEDCRSSGIDGRYPIIQLVTKTGDVIYFKMTDNPAPKNFMELAEEINVILALKKWYEDLRFCRAPYLDQKFSSVELPKISFDGEIDISWIERLYSDEAFVAKAKQVATINMNQFGFDCKSGVGLQFVKISFSKKEESLIFNKPFYMFIERPGCDRPIFEAYIDNDSLITK